QLSLHQALELCNFYLEGAFKTVDRDIALLLCHDAEVSLSQAKNADKQYPDHLKDTRYQAMRNEIAAAYIDLGELVELQGFGDKAELIRKKSEKWGGTIHDHGRLVQSLLPGFMQSSKGVVGSAGNPQFDGSVDPSFVDKQITGRTIATVSSHIFPKNIQLSFSEIKLPEPDERLINTPQLAYCLGLLQAVRSPTDTLEPIAHKWLQVVEKDTDEQERLHAMATD
ncbi:hypothetical protein BGX31_004114, partial [Mortierella sp. GBA43]